jgi:hypothetical protein
MKILSFDLSVLSQQSSNHLNYLKLNFPLLIIRRYLFLMLTSLNGSSTKNRPTFLFEGYFGHYGLPR